MDFELPSLPKGMVLNFALITAILMGALIATVGFWTFLPLFMEPAPAKQSPSLAVNFSYMRTVSPGTDWNINGTAINPSNGSLNNIKIRVFSDGNVEGYELVIPSLAAGERADFVLYPKIKPSAAMGKFTVQTVVSVPDTFPAEYELNVTISKEAILQHHGPATIAGLMVLYKQKVAAGMKYTETKNGDTVTTYTKGDKFKMVGNNGGITTTLLFDGVNSYMIVNGTAYNMGSGGTTTNYLEILPDAKIIGSDTVDGKDATVIEQNWEDKSLNGTSDSMLTKLWYWEEEGVPLKGVIYRNGKLEYELLVSDIVFGGVKDSDFELPVGIPIKPFIQFS